VGPPARPEHVARPGNLSAAPSEGPSGAWRVIRSRNFGPYFVGNAASASGTWFQNLAASIFVFQLTHSAFLLGLLNFCQFVPVLLLAPWTGGVADRHDRRRLLLVTQSAAAAVSGLLALVTWNGWAGAWTVIGFSGALGVLTAFSNPAQTAMVGSLVDRDDLPQAIALNSMTFNLARAIGPVTAAAVIAAFGVPAAFAVNAGSFLLFVGALTMIRLRETRRARRAPFRESLALVRSRPHLALYLLVVLTISFSTDPVNTESPAFATAFGLHTAWSGVIVGAFGAGAVVAALFLAGRVTGTRRRMALTLAGCGGGVLLFSLSPWFGLALGFLVVAGFGYLGSNASATSRLQLGVAEEERGRIMALWSICFLGIRPVASLIDGSLAEAFGVRAAGVVMSLPALFGAALAANLIRVRLPRSEEETV
jgi:MFS family permease